MFENLKADFRRFYIIEGGKENPPSIRKIKIVIFCYGLQALIVYRFGVWVENNFTSIILRPIKWLLSRSYHCLNFMVIKMYGIRLEKKAQIGRGFYIGHFGGIDINCCHIGKNCSIHQNVRIGNSHSGISEIAPNIGDNVWIGAHAVVANETNIEDYSTISAGTLVGSGKTVQKYFLVMGPKARAVRKDYDNTILLGVTKDEKDLLSKYKTFRY